ncbi:hypothetical protein CEXT_306811 [Caerostris extrusa]|uniref:Uncharacterized protein n=1 Tax=Caerostris extrusa TaxID=172846 RepID=A0AAV4YCP5_CAEEX|nr:hypothetical protein CEXT_306811 [Caerostris extrusa]
MSRSGRDCDLVSPEVFLQIFSNAMQIYMTMFPEGLSKPYRLFSSPSSQSLQVYDSCGHKELAMRYMTELFPIMKSGSLECSDLKDNSSSVIGE